MVKGAKASEESGGDSRKCRQSELRWREVKARGLCYIGRRRRQWSGGPIVLGNSTASRSAAADV